MSIEISRLANYSVIRGYHYIDLTELFITCPNQHCSMWAGMTVMFSHSIFAT